MPQLTSPLRGDSLTLTLRLRGMRLRYLYEVEEMLSRQPPSTWRSCMEFAVKTFTPWRSHKRVIREKP